MKPRTIEKLLYKIAAILVVAGAVIRILHLSATGLGLYLILAGHLAGVAAILLYMKYVNSLEEQNKTHNQSEKQLEHK